MPARGRLERDNRKIDVNVAVSYALDEWLGVWVPVEMGEAYATGDDRLMATATYHNYRRFGVGARVLTPCD